MFFFAHFKKNIIFATELRHSDIRQQIKKKRFNLYNIIYFLNN